MKPSVTKTKEHPYRNSDLSAARRVKDLLSRMTPEEKTAQMICVWQRKAESLVDADGNFDLRKAKSAFKNGRGIGRVGRSSEAGEGRDARGTAELTNAFRDSFSRTHGWGFP